MREMEMSDFVTCGRALMAKVSPEAVAAFDQLLADNSQLLRDNPSELLQFERDRWTHHLAMEQERKGRIVAVAKAFGEGVGPMLTAALGALMERKQAPPTAAQTTQAFDVISDYKLDEWWLEVCGALAHLRPETKAYVRAWVLAHACGALELSFEQEEKLGQLLTEDVGADVFDAIARLTLGAATKHAPSEAEKQPIVTPWPFTEKHVRLAAKKLTNAQRNAIFYFISTKSPAPSPKLSVQVALADAGLVDTKGLTPFGRAVVSYLLSNDGVSIRAQRMYGPFSNEI